MQEKFKRTLKHIGVLGTTVAMLGATLTGALAAGDLSDYPSQFGGKDTVFVVGSAASSDDSDAVSDIFMGLPASKTSSASAPKASARRSSSGGNRYEKFEDLPLTADFNDTNDGFGATVTADDLEGLLDTTLAIDIGATDNDYDVRDEIRFSGGGITGNVLRPHTGLTAPNVEDDFAERVFVPMVRNSWGYYFVFQDSLKQGNFISNATNSEPIQLEFLGKLFDLEGARTGTITDDTRVIMNVGQKFYMNAGDCVVVDGKEVCLVQTASTAATVSVDGVREVISQNDDKRVNGLEIRIEDVSSDEGVEFDSASLFVGEKARETFDDGEEFIGEDQDDPAWTWNLANLTSSNPVFGIRWSLDLDFPEETDNPLYEHPLYEGESICLPFDYACLEFDSLQIDDYQDYEIIGGVTKDLYWSPNDADVNVKNVTAERVVQLRAKGSNNNGFQCQTSLSDPTLVDTDTIALAVNRSNGALMVYREQQDGSKDILCRSLVGGENWTESQLGDAFRVKYRDTVINVDLLWHIPAIPTKGSGTAYVGETATDASPGIDALAWNNYTPGQNTTGIPAERITGNVGPAYGFIRFLPITKGTNISVYFETDEGAVTNAGTEWNDFEYLGDSDSDTSTAFDLIYGGVNGAQKQYNQSTTLSASTYLVSGSTDINGFKESTRAGNGVIILDPEAHQGADKQEFRVPSKLADFKANMVLRTSGSAGAGAKVTTPASTSMTPTTMLDTEVKDLTQYNAVVVGGPAVNKAAADLLGLTFPTYGSSGSLPFGAGEAVIELKANGSKSALLVAGYDSQDTRRAGVVLKNHADFAASLKGMSVKVTGTSLDVSGITVAAA